MSAFSITRFSLLLQTVYPTLSLFVNNVLITEQDTIELLYNQSYTIACSSIGSKPDVSLSIFEFLNNVPLSNGQNNITTGSCDPNTLLCNQILQIVFSYDNTNNVFDRMTRLTCLAESKQPDLYPLSVSISRSVNVVLPPLTTTTISSSTIIPSSTIGLSSTSEQLSTSPSISDSSSTTILVSTSTLEQTSEQSSSTQSLPSSSTVPLTTISLSTSSIVSTSTASTTTASIGSSALPSTSSPETSFTSQLPSTTTQYLTDSEMTSSNPISSSSTLVPLTSVVFSTYTMSSSTPMPTSTSQALPSSSDKITSTVATTLITTTVVPSTTVVSTSVPTAQTTEPQTSAIQTSVSSSLESTGPSLSSTTQVPQTSTAGITQSTTSNNLNIIKTLREDRITDFLFSGRVLTTQTVVADQGQSLTLACQTYLTLTLP